MDVARDETMHQSRAQLANPPFMTQKFDHGRLLIEKLFFSCQVYRFYLSDLGTLSNMILFWQKLHQRRKNHVVKTSLSNLKSAG